MSMNIHHSVWRMAQVPLFEAIIMSKAILFWRIVFLTRDVSVFGKDRLSRLSFKACWVNVGRASVFTMSSWPVEGQRCWPNYCTSGETEHAPGLEEREAGSFRNLTWLYIPHILARGVR